METSKHPHWEQEHRHLKETFALIEREVKRIEEETGVGAGEEKVVVVPGDLAVHERVAMDIYKRKISSMHQLSMAKSKPYFARLDFTPKEHEKETYYVGRWGVMDTEKLSVEVVDWRSPAANLYYSGQIGDVSYAAPDGKVEGDLSLKRMIAVENRALYNISDVGIAGQEAYLQEILGQATSNRLKDIVTTIQAEQNIVIRHSPFMPLMVQGVAGSGKTTIALHRIAWLLYAYQKVMKPEQMMIVAPNPLFLDYISQVLPDLGVEEVIQTTFEELCGNWLKGKMPKIAKAQGVEERIMFGEKAYGTKEKVMGQKGALEFLYALESFLDHWEKTLLPKEKMNFGQQQLFSFKELENIFYTQLKHFPWKERIKEFKKMYHTRLNTVSHKMTRWLQKRCDEKLEKILLLSEEDEKKQRVQKLLSSRDARTKQVEQEKEKIAKAFDSLWPDFDLVKIYKEFILYIEKTEKYRELSRYTQNMIEENQLCLEDLPPIVEIGRRIIAFPQKDIRHVVVDEAQDFSPFMIHLLQKYAGNNSFTLVGDVLQGIHGAQGITDWKIFKDKNFLGDGTVCHLSTSYRSTAEIMETAQQVLKNSGLMNDYIFNTIPRHGDEVEVIKTDEEIKEIVKTITGWQGKGYGSIAVICRTDKECSQIYQQLKKQMPVLMLSQKQTVYQGGICVVALGMAKGLEFDGVIIPGCDEIHYPKEAFYGKLLYVACTRALHQLKIIFSGEKTQLLDGCAKEKMKGLLKISGDSKKSKK